jgi:hypothetical protein
VLILPTQTAGSDQMSDCSYSPNGNRRTNAAKWWSGLLAAITITGLSLVVA